MTFLICTTCGEEYPAGLALAHRCRSMPELVLEVKGLREQIKRLNDCYATACKSEQASTDELVKANLELAWLRRLGRDAVAAMEAADEVADVEDEHPDRDNLGASMTPMQRIRFALASAHAELKAALSEGEDGDTATQKR
jgi:hypothetical protein